jgi:hypothetical protein
MKRSSIYLALASTILAGSQQLLLARTTPSASLKDHPGWVQIPGAIIRQDCVYEIPKGAQVSETGDVTLAGTLIAHYDDCSEQPIRTRPSHGAVPAFKAVPGAGNGWVEAVQEEVSLSSGDNIDKITGEWVVPSDPTDNGGLIFLFNGLEDTTQNLIIQPVLQFGYTSCGICVEGGGIGGNYWVIASWMVGKNGYHSPGERVAPGDTIEGATYITSVSKGTLNWEIKAKDTTSGAFSDIAAFSSGHVWNWAYAGTLEMYGITSCSEFPASGSTTFKDNSVYHGYPKFDSVSSSWYGAVYSYGGPACGFSPLGPCSSFSYAPSFDAKSIMSADTTSKSPTLASSALRPYSFGDPYSLGR